MKTSWILTLCAVALSGFEGAQAKPIAYARGSTAMFEYGGGGMLESQMFYAPRFNYSFGLSALRLENTRGTRDQAVARANYLVRRWNLPSAQGNLFGYAGIGAARTHYRFGSVRGADGQQNRPANASGFASSAGWQADFETRWFYSSARMDWNHALSQSYRIDTTQLGLAPYAHGYQDWATFFLLQARHFQGEIGAEKIESGVELAALVRLFRGNFWLEAGVTDRGKPQAMLMMNF